MTNHKHKKKQHTSIWEIHVIARYIYIYIYIYYSTPQLIEWIELRRERFRKLSFWVFSSGYLLFVVVGVGVVVVLLFESQTKCATVAVVIQTS